MAVFTVHLPDAIHSRLELVATQRQVSMNELFEEMSTIIIAEFDAEAHFHMGAAEGSAQHGLVLLETLRRRHQE